jgi:hypothetical protein
VAVETDTDTAKPAPAFGNIVERSAEGLAELQGRP